jgi:nucleotide-binding universal stress UspA family protein
VYSHILIPTDGSNLSLKAAKVGAELAKALGAKASSVYVIEPYRPPYAGEGVFFNDSFTEQEYVKAMHRHAQKVLAKIDGIAAKSDVKVTPESIIFDTPWEGIIKAAGKLKCDLIVMASHGRSGLSGVVIGSQTNRVLTHSKIPVLVCR